LNIDDNEIAHLPDAIGHCTRLTLLSFCNNKLKTLPAAMETLTGLRDLRSPSGRKLISLSCGTN